jgi:hypothetical protein
MEANSEVFLLFGVAESKKSVGCDGSDFIDSNPLSFFKGGHFGEIGQKYKSRSA